MKIKAVMCDIEGTLLTKDNIISTKTIDTMKAIRKKGILFGLCTRHDISSVLYQLKKWNIEGEIDAIIGSSGSEIYDLSIDTKFDCYPLKGDFIMQMIHYFEKLDVNFAISHHGFLYTPKDDYQIRLLSEVYHIPYQSIDFHKLLKEPKQKLMVITSTSNEIQLIKKSKAFKNLQYHRIPLNRDHILFEFMDQHVSKTNALEEFMSWHNYTMDELCTFGDAENDYDMTLAAGMGVIMKNGCEKCKRVADYITDDNNHDGIAKFLNTFILS